MPRLRSKSIDIVFAFDEHNSRLAAAVRPDTFRLYSAPAINLFEKTSDRIPVKSNTHEYHVVPDRSRYLEYEPHQVLEVYAHFPADKDKRPVRPLYSAAVDRTSGSVEGLYFTVRRLPRRRTVGEKTYGASSDYTGTDMFLSLLEPGELSGEGAVADGTSVTPFLAAMDGDVAEAELASCGAGGVVAELALRVHRSTSRGRVWRPCLEECWMDPRLSSPYPNFTGACIRKTSPP